MPRLKGSPNREAAGTIFEDSIAKKPPQCRVLTCTRDYRSFACIVNRLHQSTTLSLLNVTKYEIRNEMIGTTMTAAAKANPNSKPCCP